MPKTYLVILITITIFLTALSTLYLNNAFVKGLSKSEIDTAVNQAKFLYSQKRSRGEDFSKGSCLSEALMPGWVVDMVHNPREPIDDLPENQCLSYREGRAKHFVELDINGNLVRVK